MKSFQIRQSFRRDQAPTGWRGGTELLEKCAVGEELPWRRPEARRHVGATAAAPGIERWGVSAPPIHDQGITIRNVAGSTRKNVW